MALVQPEPQDRLVRQVQLVLQVSQVIRVRRELKVLPVQLELRVTVEQQGLRDQLGSQVNKALSVQRVQKAAQGQLGQWEELARLDLLVQVVTQDRVV